jgi:hypothetical protein
MRRPAKTSQIQIRVTAAEKAELVRRARAAGQDLSAWMLGRLSPRKSERFNELCRELGVAEQPAYVLAEINDLLSDLKAADFESTVESPPRAKLGDLRANQLAAMVDTAAARVAKRPPRWVDQIPPLRVPWFASELVSVRIHLLTSSPPAFRKRNLFVDSTLEDRA